MEIIQKNKKFRVEEATTEATYISNNITLILQKARKGLNSLGIKTEVIEPFNNVKTNVLKTVGDFPLQIKDISEYKTKKQKSKLYFEMPEQPRISVETPYVRETFSFIDTSEFYKTLANAIRENQNNLQEEFFEEKLQKEAEAEILALPLYKDEFVIDNNPYLEKLILNLKLLKVNYSLEVVTSCKAPCYPASEDVIKLTIVDNNKTLTLTTFNCKFENSLEISVKDVDDVEDDLNYSPGSKNNENNDERMRHLINKLIQ